MFSPYIGVTGFTVKREVTAATNVYDDLSDKGERLLMIGVLASSKTLAGRPNKWPNRYPKVQNISQLFPPHRRTVNLIHYATDDQATLSEQLQKLELLGGRNLDGFQLNMAWPDPNLIIVSEGKRVVLQLGRRALEDFSDNPENVARQLEHYKGIVTDVLIDASGGCGVPMDLEIVEDYVHTLIARHGSWLGIGVAGGLFHENMSQLRQLVEKFPNISVDAEGRLRTASDNLHYGLVESYILAASELFTLS